MCRFLDTLFAGSGRSRRIVGVELAVHPYETLTDHFRCMSESRPDREDADCIYTEGKDRAHSEGGQRNLEGLVVLRTPFGLPSIRSDPE
jgi:hypothetical protein